MKKLLLVILVCSVITSSALALDQAGLIEQTRWRINDVTSTITTDEFTWTTDIIKKRINIAQKEIAYKTKCLHAMTVIFSSTSVSEYSKPSDLIVIDRLAFATTAGSTSTYKKMTYMRPTGMDRDKGRWDGEGGTGGRPTTYFERAGKFGLYPIPSSSFAGTDTVRIEYYKIPDDLTVSTHTAWDNDRSLYGYHYLIVERVVIMCLQDKYEYNAIVKGLKDEYRYEIEEMRKEIKSRPDLQEKLNVRMR